jgi:hypothetical protein
LIVMRAMGQFLAGTSGCRDQTSHEIEGAACRCEQFGGVAVRPRSA